MINTVTTIANILFAWTVMFLVLSWMLAGAYSFFSSFFARMKVTHGAWLTLAYGLMAPVAATLTLMILYMPTLAFSLVTDHCHGALCTPHTLQMTTETFNGMVTVTLIVITLVSVGTLMVMQSLSGRRRLQTLSDLSESTSKYYRLVDNPAAIAWCAGLFRPQVFLSSGLVNSLSARQLQIILTHELAHALRRDNLSKWCLHWATIAWPQSRRQRIRQEFFDYTEQISDLAAAYVHQGKTDLVDLIRLLDSCCASSSKHNNSARQDHIIKRIIALEHELERQTDGTTTQKESLFPGYAVASVWLVFIVMAVHYGHPLLEWLSR
ncbi:M56 family metallopeptidase [Candidatus Thiodiazotropha endoloripes]|uniref:M56 family metallopeptidase n=1 Tax=Candidatus Thiodiazotropha endoloripes TaxID=1818881 RepID=UPI0009F22C14|nr:M56 family metallopeptidase [Candidatus Thiodiazotropha endoloripes]